MKKLLKIFQTVRNNWKKSAFAAAVLSYGVNYGKSSYETRQLMRKYCEEASKYGNESSPLHQPLRRITVILNPVAKKRKSKELYEKYCAPLLHLAGVIVTVVQTEYEGQAKDLPVSLDPTTDAIVIAGGDGTLSETVTGLLRRAEGNIKALQGLPIAVLPLGKTCELAKTLYGDEDLVKSLADATMSVIDGSLRQLDVIKIEPLEEEGKPVFSLSRVEWGAHRDVSARQDKYWLLGPLREYASYLFFGAPKPAEWIFEYCEPCRGCSKCYIPDSSPRRWWHSFLPKTKPEAHLLVPNENCGVMQDKSLKTVHWSVATDTVAGEVEHPLSTKNGEIPVARAPQLSLEIGPVEQSMSDFIGEGWDKVSGDRPNPDIVLPARYLRIHPTEKKEDSWYSIDSENFEMKPVALTLIPRAVNVFTPRRDRRL